MDRSDVIGVRVERWRHGRKGLAEELGVLELRPTSLAGTYEACLSYGGVPTRERRRYTVVASNPDDLWRLVRDALWPIGDTKKRGVHILDVEAG